MRSFHSILLANAFLLCVTLFATLGCDSFSPTATGETASYPFDFELTSVDGETVSKSDFEGKVLVVDIWGTWCPPCQKEVPHFIELQKELSEQGFQVVGINYENGDENEMIDTINAFTEQIPINYPLLLGTQEVQEQIPDFSGFPTTIFIDRQGVVRRTVLSYHSTAELRAYIEPLL